MKFCSCFLFIVVFNFLSFCSDIVKTELTFLNLFKKSSEKFKFLLWQGASAEKREFKSALKQGHGAYWPIWLR